MDNLKVATIVAIFEEVGLSINAHVPLTKIQRHFRRDQRGFCKDALRELVRAGLVNMHPTGGSMTYSFTAEGIIEVRKILGT